MAELNIVEKVIALEGVELLKNLTPDQLSRIATIAKEEHHPPGKVVLEPNKALEALYVILDGSVELSQSSGAATTARQNDVLGAWALFDPEPLPVAAKTTEDTRLLLPGVERGQRLRNIFTGEEVTAGEHQGQAAVTAAEVFASFPVALLM